VGTHSHPYTPRSLVTASAGPLRQAGARRAAALARCASQPGQVVSQSTTCRQDAANQALNKGRGLLPRNPRRGLRDPEARQQRSTKAEAAAPEIPWRSPSGRPSSRSLNEGTGSRPRNPFNFSKNQQTAGSTQRRLVPSPRKSVDGAKPDPNQSTARDVVGALVEHGFDLVPQSLELPAGVSDYLSTSMTPARLVT
jgi:hypothetical protein